MEEEEIKEEMVLPVRAKRAQGLEIKVEHSNNNVGYQDEYSRDWDDRSVDEKQGEEKSIMIQEETSLMGLSIKTNNQRAA